MLRCSNSSSSTAPGVGPRDAAQHAAPCRGPAVRATRRRGWPRAHVLVGVRQGAGRFGFVDATEAASWPGQVIEASARVPSWLHVTQRDRVQLVNAPEEFVVASGSSRACDLVQVTCGSC
jgi:hypothetical protein